MSIPLGAPTHKCPKTGCPRRVAHTQYSCPAHWAQVSPALRRAINRTYTAGDYHAHQEAMDNANTELNGVVS